MIGILLAAAVASSSPKSQAQIDYEIMALPVMLSYQLCLSEKALKYSKTSELLNDVVDAAFGGCLEERSQLAKLPKEVGLKVSSTGTERTLEWIDAKERSRLKSFVLDLRAPK